MKEKIVDYTELSKEEFENLYFEKYKRFFKDKLPYGLECYQGWHNIIWDLTQAIENYMGNNNAPQDMQITQIKQKFGGLRFYTNKGDGTIWGMIRFAEDQSYKICEKCGERGTLDTEFAYVITLCEGCQVTRKERIE